MLFGAILYRGMACGSFWKGEQVVGVGVLVLVLVLTVLVVGDGGLGNRIRMILIPVYSDTTACSAVLHGQSLGV